MITIKSDEQLANETIVTRRAKELARDHIADALLDACRTLCRDLHRLSSDHYDRLTNGAPVGKSGFDLAGGLMATLLDTAPIDYRKLVNEANEDEDVIDEDTVQDDVRAYVDGIMDAWVKQGIGASSRQLAHSTSGAQCCV